MKNIFLIVISFLILSGCQTDDFYGTERYFLTDKESYQIGDEIELTAVIKSEQEKEIRFYDNFKNLEISFALMNGPNNEHNGSWSSSTGDVLEESDILKFEVAKGKPFVKKYKVKIEGSDNQIHLVIPEINYKASFAASEFDNTTMVRIHGFCMPINPGVGDSLEDYFEAKDIKIENKNTLQQNL